MDRKWPNMTEYIPTAPEDLEARWEIHQDQWGNMVPVINARWKIRADGSISHLKGTELHVLLGATNQNLCVRYSFFQQLKTKNPARENWSFSIATVEVEPGQTYRVSIFNIPEPELLHSEYDVSRVVTVPGSLWSPNITEVRDSTTLSVGFNTNELAERYRVLVSCRADPQHKVVDRDHPLYRAVVLQLCAFLKSKCGADVLVDLLDATMVGTVGATRWLEWRRQQLKHPMDKILILCSRGVQAKWRAMCGEECVLLCEDVLSPNDDMLVPFLNLFLPNMHRPATLGKYIVAYFEDISDERDVPSVFDLGVKYRLMKHFEELFFRILEMEKYQPGKVNHIEGIGKEEYFNCGSGKALRDAIETFRAYQMENPDWFEAECVASEEEAVAKQNLLNRPLEILPVLERIPLIREGPPIFMRQVEVIHNANTVYVLTPELNYECETTSVVKVEPRVNPASQEEPYQLNALLVNPPVGENRAVAVPLRMTSKSTIPWFRAPGLTKDSRLLSFPPVQISRTSGNSKCCWGGPNLSRSRRRSSWCGSLERAPARARIKGTSPRSRPSAVAQSQRLIR
ncbi:hypothetical protein CRUP_025843 [Coryphaenoides rupestris]|nr:hypothetical protein CRUP_025843 [Coryphaenoides rupestris]